MAIGMVSAAIGVYVATHVSDRPEPLAEPTIRFRGYITNDSGLLQAEFAVLNPNRCRLVFRAFGPQIQGADGVWPNEARGLGKLQRVATGGQAILQTPQPAGSASWRFMVNYERAPGFWDAAMSRLRIFESRLGLPPFPLPPADRESPPPIVVTMKGDGKRN